FLCESAWRASPLDHSPGYGLRFCLSPEVSAKPARRTTPRRVVGRSPARIQPLADEWPDLGAGRPADEHVDVAEVAGEAGLPGEELPGAVCRGDGVWKRAEGRRWCAPARCSAHHDDWNLERCGCAAVVRAVAPSPVTGEVAVHPLDHD